MCTHDNLKKKFTFKWLPSPAMAPPTGSRGTESMKTVLASRVKHGSFVVHDKWLATEKAVRELKYAGAPAVNHAQGFRSVESGWHSNDIESEFGRLRPSFNA